ncbi:YceI family protein [Chryseobacterium gambrini]|uniref:YceI family protein n=2 Tax=Chryseobacterium TaxID=59732 RepID=A0AAJ1R171_9FLAO|nr:MULTISPECIES: YceI family protein [Chryseobacterium]MCF2220430.1 YceI family protein [Chryseobacterium sp. PS-8]MDN4011876.1 YceI family protein [Chryseobacterium gambrini]MDN4029419.1 YceI family protein [Chryseobacterium gambrini]QWA40633.1 YceI family protein [Chryseobacterium sp. ZHDP1]
MKKLILIISALFFTNLAFAQKYMSKTGKVSFEASVPLFEDVFAQDDNNVAVINADTGEFASVSVVKNYHFKTKLMEEHFNESYAETAKYPKATFTGKILNFDKSKLSASPQKYTVQGKLNFHGVDKAYNSTAAIYSKDGKIYMSGGFIVKTADHKVTIPKMVSKKIAESVNVQYNYVLTKQ